MKKDRKFVRWCCCCCNDENEKNSRCFCTFSLHSTIGKGFTWEKRKKWGHEKTTLRFHCKKKNKKIKTNRYIPSTKRGSQNRHIHTHTHTKTHKERKSWQHICAFASKHLNLAIGLGFCEYQIRPLQDLSFHEILFFFVIFLAAKKPTFKIWEKISFYFFHSFCFVSFHFFAALQFVQMRKRWVINSKRVRFYSNFFVISHRKKIFTIVNIYVFQPSIIRHFKQSA